MALQAYAPPPGSGYPWQQMQSGDLERHGVDENLARD